jgi:LysM repeat protein
VKKIRSTFLGILSLSVVLVLVAGCYKPAAPDVTPTTAGGAEAGTPGEVPDIEATAIARSTESAATMAAQTPGAEGEGAGEGEEEEATEAPTEMPETPTPEPTTAPTTAAATPAPTSAPTATPVPPVSGATTHVVQPGENMFRIALRYGTTVEAIAQANGIANPRLIYVGQELTIPSTSGQPAQPAQPSPGGNTYVVQPGDNLFRIALRYNMSHVTLAQYNGIAYPYYVYVGQIIRIPPQ